ncbi:MAG: polysaccharide deacetylase family protein [Psychromonas sp.]
MIIKLQKVLSDIEISINEASSHYEIWWALGYSENRNKYRDVFDHEDFNYFLHTSYIANQMAMLMALSRSFDDIPSTSNIRSLKLLLTQGGFEDLSKVISETLSPHQNIVKKIKDIRCNLIAHTDSSQTDQKVLARNGIKPDEIKELIESVKEALIKVTTSLRVHNLCYKKGFHNESTLKVLEKLKV